jgi:hypothetical protein
MADWRKNFVSTLTSKSPVEEELVPAFVASLQNILPNPELIRVIRAEQFPNANDLGLDALVRLRLGQAKIALICEVKKNVFPRDVRETLWRLQRLKFQGLDGDERTVPFLIAESISQGAREFLRSQDAGYFDLSGSVYLPPSAGAFIYVDKGVRPQKSRQASPDTLFEGRSARVIHYLLQNPQVWLGVSALAKAAHVAGSTVSRTLLRLERFELLDVRGAGPNKERKVKNPTQLLDGWAKVSRERPARFERFFVPAFSAGNLQSVASLFENMSTNRVPIGLTHELGAQLYAPFLTNVSTVRCRVARGRIARGTIEKLGGKRVDAGFNLALIDVESDADLFKGPIVEGVQLVSPIQVYLDLQGSEGRAKEAADHLRSTCIGY